MYAGVGVLERRPRAGERGGELVEVTGQDEYVDVRVRSPYPIREQVERPPAGDPVAGRVVVEQRTYGGKSF
jgi:hypothetical protein